jgi:hypothetical protein
MITVKTLAQLDASPHKTDRVAVFLSVDKPASSIAEAAAFGLKAVEERYTRHYWIYALNFSDDGDRYGLALYCRDTRPTAAVLDDITWLLEHAEFKDRSHSTYPAMGGLGVVSF